MSEEGVCVIPRSNPASLESSICISALTSFVNLSSNTNPKRNGFLSCYKERNYIREFD